MLRESRKKQAYQAEVNYLLARQQLMLRVTNAYFAVLQAQDSLEFVQAEKRAIERQLEQTKHRFSVGLTAITDVHEAQAQFDKRCCAGNSSAKPGRNHARRSA